MRPAVSGYLQGCWLMNAGMLDYGLCDQTVTVYRRRGQQILRQVVSGCYFQCQEQRPEGLLGHRKDFRFLLVMPGSPQRVFPGDRIMTGIGPEVAPEDWAGFLPAVVPGLYEAAYAAPYYLGGTLCHVEAGKK